MSNSDKLSYTEIKFIKKLASGMGRVQAAQESFNVNSYGSAAVTATKTLKKVNVQQALEEALIKHGITVDKAVEPIKHALKATKQISVGEEVYESVDHNIRLKASQMALNVLGVNKQEQTGNTFVFNQTERKYIDVD